MIKKAAKKIAALLVNILLVVVVKFAREDIFVKMAKKKCVQLETLITRKNKLNVRLALMGVIKIKKAKLPARFAALAFPHRIKNPAQLVFNVKLVNIL